MFRAAAGVIVVLVSIASIIPANARDKVNSDSSGRSRMQTTLALIAAGGGPADFKTTTLIGVLAGAAANAQVAGLTKRYGAENVKAFITIFDFTVAAELRLLKHDRMAEVQMLQPDPADGKTLSVALYALGVDPATHRFRAGLLLDNLLTRPVRLRITKSIDARYGAQADARYQTVLARLTTDLRDAAVL